jgi:ParB/RepB/Spo0J family partition protein
MKINFKFPEIVALSDLMPNEYNPNKMPKKEMSLLGECITTYGFLFPIITFREDGKYRIVDGEHRYWSLKKLGSDKALVVILDLTKEQAVQLTMLMNKIKGMHSIEKDAKVVILLTQLGMSDFQICENLGMEAETFLRLKQQLGVANAFKNHEYTKAWDVKNNDNEK